MMAAVIYSGKGNVDPAHCVDVADNIAAAAVAKDEATERARAAAAAVAEQQGKSSTLASIGKRE